MHNPNVFDEHPLEPELFLAYFAGEWFLAGMDAHMLDLVLPTPEWNVARLALVLHLSGVLENVHRQLAPPFELQWTVFASEQAIFLVAFNGMRNQFRLRLEAMEANATLEIVDFHMTK